jgi:hypothetical protein
MTQASVQIAVDMVKEGLINEAEALLRLDAERMTHFLHPTIDPKTARVRIQSLDGLRDNEVWLYWPIPLPPPLMDLLMS